MSDSATGAVRSTIRACLSAACVAAGTVTVVACDSVINVEGKVYGRPPSDTLRPSEVVVDGQGVDTRGLVPLPRAVVLLFVHAADTSAINPDTMLYVRTDTSTEDGSFHAFAITHSVRFTAALRVRRPGYRGVNVAFVHGSTDTHHPVVILTPLPPDSSAP